MNRKTGQGYDHRMARDGMCSRNRFELEGIRSLAEEGADRLRGGTARQTKAVPSPQTAGYPEFFGRLIVLAMPCL